MILIRGAAGMGKTTLAVWWAHQLGAYPDGQLFLDLRGDAPAVAPEPADVLAQVLTGLGVPAERLPADLPARSALYRTLARGKRLLVMADNVASVEQVLVLVPPERRSPSRGDSPGGSFPGWASIRPSAHSNWARCMPMRHWRC